MFEIKSPDNPSIVVIIHLVDHLELSKYKLHFLMQ